MGLACALNRYRIPSVSRMPVMVGRPSAAVSVHKMQIVHPVFWTLVAENSDVMMSRASVPTKHSSEKFVRLTLSA